ncbi:MAG: SCP2 sterol-binding domain-containing protein [Lachnospiraceae bacterium]|nr:SCP2 sterol-binding domain-containing protein [Lachnospiraceae bacterium]
MTYEEIVSYVSKKATKLKAKSEAAVQVDITGEGEGAFYVAVKEGKIEVAPYEYFDHDAKVVADGNDFIAYLDGKADESVISIIGDVEKAAVIKELVSKAAAKPAEKKAPAKAAAKPAAKKAPAKAAAKPAEKKAEPVKEAPKAEEKKAEPAKAAEKKAEPAKAAEKKAEPAKAAAKPAAKKPAAKKPAAKKK